VLFLFFFQAEDGIRDRNVTGVQTCALPISSSLIHFGTKLLSGFSLARKYFATAKCSTSPSASLAPRSCRTIFTFIQVLCRPALLVSPRETGAKPCATLFLTPRWRSALPFSL